MVKCWSRFRLYFVLRALVMRCRAFRGQSFITILCVFPIPSSRAGRCKHLNKNILRGKDWLFKYLRHLKRQSLICSADPTRSSGCFGASAARSAPRGWPGSGDLPGSRRRRWAHPPDGWRGQEGRSPDAFPAKFRLSSKALLLDSFMAFARLQSH